MGAPFSVPGLYTGGPLSSQNLESARITKNDDRLNGLSVFRFNSSVCVWFYGHSAARTKNPTRLPHSSRVHESSRARFHLVEGYKDHLCNNTVKRHFATTR